MSSLEDTLKATIRDVPDFPKPGILFKDITPILSRPDLMKAITDHFAARYADQNIDVVVGMESRGFLFGVPLAMQLDAAFVPARKPGKLPAESIAFEYTLEYGTNKLEMHADAITEGQRVLIIDDLLATGGTANATVQLVQTLKGEVVECAFVIGLDFLEGDKAFAPIPSYSLIHF
ncbi:MAG: adenine phosphoribosyltransferase [Myxococcota bacterium]